MSGEKSRQWLARAERRIPGGVNSPVRAFKAVGGAPPFISHASGARLTDVDGKTYLDYVGSWGPLILGHAHPAVVAAVEQAARRGTSFGAPRRSKSSWREKSRRASPPSEKGARANTRPRPGSSRPGRSG